MAMYEFKSYIRFDGKGGNTFAFLEDTDGTLNDGENDIAFSGGEAVSGGPNAFLGYSGKATIDGELMPVFWSTMTLDWYAFSSRDAQEVSPPDVMPSLDNDDFFTSAPPPPPAPPQSPTNLDSGASNINIDGAVTNYIDFGGEDTFTVLPSIGNDVQIVDNNATTILLPAGMQIDGARFLADGVQFDINGNTLTLLGSPADFSFVFAGTPLDSTAGNALTLEQTAAEFGASIPELGEAAVEATVLGVISNSGGLDPFLGEPPM